MRTTLFVIVLMMISLAGCRGGTPTPASPAQTQPQATAAAATPVDTPGMAPTPGNTNTPEVPTATTLVEPIETGTTAPPAEATAEPTFAPEVLEGDFDGFLLEDVGFAVPESILYDQERDIYLVSNINGNPSARDGNGFVSQVSPEGEVIQLKWLDGAAGGYTLNAPKGMALLNGNLYVADIDTVRVFDAATGAYQGDVLVNEAVSLNDAAADPRGWVYVVDSGTGRLFSVMEDMGYSEVFSELELGSLNGVEVLADGVYLTDDSGPRVIRVSDDGTITTMCTFPTMGLDGLVLLEDRSMLVSSWIGNVIYLCSPEGEVTVAVENRPAPADIGFDPLRFYILIPWFMGDKVEAVPYE